MDFLGLTNLTILANVRAAVADRRGMHLDLARIPLDDARTFDLLSSGETTGVFQLEGSGMRRYIQKLKPTSLGDVSAMIALYRPGPMEHIDTFIDAKHGRAPIRYPHPTMQDILEETYGVIVYQDQVLLIAQAFAGYTLGEADVVRKAMGKKNPQVMQKEKERFVEGATGKGFSWSLAEEVFQLIEPFAGYAFNKAHSVSYAMIAYWTAFFKANYPEEYMAAVMNAHSGQTDKIATDVAECLRLGIRVLLPNVNRSEPHFSIEECEDGPSAIRFGLASVKNVGAMAVSPLVEERKHKGPYGSVEDLCRRADMASLNRRSLESLIKVGAFDDLGSRASLLASVERITSLAQSEAQLKTSGQTSMFDLLGDTASTPVIPAEPDDNEVNHRERLAWEKELLGSFISENPLSALAHRLPSNVFISRDRLEGDVDGKRVNLVGQVSSHRNGLTREGKPFTSVALEMLGGSVEVMVWSNAYDKTQHLWFEGSLVEVTGRVRLRDDGISISCDEASVCSISDDDDPAGPENREDGDSPSGSTARTPGGAFAGATDHGDDGTAPASGADGDDGAALAAMATNGNGVATPSAVAADGSHGSSPSATAKDGGNGHSPPAAKLWIRLEESSDPVQDERLLRGVVKLLMNYPGEGAVGLRIISEGRTVIGDLPLLSINYCPELHEELESMVGAGGLEIEGNGNGML